MNVVLLLLTAAGLAQGPGAGGFDALILPLTEFPGVSVLTYDVSGSSSRSVREWMDEHRPAEISSGERHDAFTQWSYVPNWARRPDGACIPSTATVSFSIRVIVPDLLTRDQMWPSERADWDRYFAVLVGHERNHARLVLAGGVRMQAALRGASDCDEMASIVQRVSTEVREASDAYDHSTDHGAREGAVFPLPRP